MYDRQKAIEYAYQWWNKRNPNYYNFDMLGGDCSNFISQCLYYGGIKMDYSHLGWFYNSINSRSPSWTGVDEFFNYSTNNLKEVGVKAKLTDFLHLDVGDVVQVKLKNESGFQHSMLVTKIVNRNNLSGILVTCHSNDAKDKKLSSYYIIEYRLLKILND